MSHYREQASRALRAMAVTSPTSYEWFGHRSRRLPPAVASVLDPGATREYLIKVVEHELYRSFYTRGRPVPHRLAEPADPRTDPAFVDALSASNHGRGGWDPGWRVEAVEGRELVVAGYGLRMRARESELRSVNGMFPGAQVCVRRPSEHRAASPGYYTAFGDAGAVAGRDAVEVRVYFNLAATGAAPLVAAATRRLNESQVPFSLKVLDHPARFFRCDAAVLYLHDGWFGRAREVLLAVVEDCALHLRVQAPAFTKSLTPGVAVAEHLPRVGASFGTTRCRLVAEGVVHAHEAGLRGLQDRLDSVARRFAEGGLDLDAPYLVGAATDCYRL